MPAKIVSVFRVDSLNDASCYTATFGNVSMVFDAAGKLTSLIGVSGPGNVAGRTTFYDPINHLTVVTSAKGRVVITVLPGRP